MYFQEASVTSSNMHQFLARTCINEHSRANVDLMTVLTSYIIAFVPRVFWQLDKYSW